MPYAGLFFFFGFKTKKTHLWQCQHNGWICNLIFWLFDFALFFFLRIDVKKFEIRAIFPTNANFQCTKMSWARITESEIHDFVMHSNCIRIAFNISSYIIDCQFPVHHLFTMRCFTYWMLANVFNQIQIRYSPLSDCDSHTYLTTSHTYPINCVALILQCNVVMHILHIIHTIISIFKTF